MSRTVIVVILIYYAVGLTVLASAYVKMAKMIDFPMPEIVSIMLLIPIYVWSKRHVNGKKLATQVAVRHGEDGLFWVFMLLALALSLRIPSTLLFGAAYEKTPLIYLVILTIAVIEETSVSVFGFKFAKISKAVVCGVTFYMVFGGTMLLVYYSMIYLFARQMPVVSYDLLPFLLAMPFMVLCVGLSEEGFFRGYVQTHIEKVYSSKTAILTQATLFGGWHFVWNLSPFRPLDMAEYVLTTFLTGMFFGYFYFKTRSLAASVVAHGLWNSVPQGIVLNSAVLGITQQLTMENRLLVSVLPCAISMLTAFLFIKYVAKRI